MPHRSLKMKCETPVVCSRSRLRLAPVLVIAALMAFCPTLMRADTIALSFTGLGAVLAPGTLGYAFTLSSPVEVTALGVFDGPGVGHAIGDGLVQSHVVTIWTSTGTQEAQGTVPSGTSATLIDGFRYVSIASVLLPAGSYTIGGSDFQGDVAFSDASTITPASGVTYDGSRAALSGGFPPGDDFFNPNSYFGPNFQFTTASVPDAGTSFSLLGLSLTGLAFLRRKLC